MMPPVDQTGGKFNLSLIQILPIKIVSCFLPSYGVASEVSP